MFIRKSVLIALFVLSSSLVFAQSARLVVSPDYLFFRQGSTPPTPITVKVSAASGAIGGSLTAKASTLGGGSWLSVSVLPTATATANDVLLSVSVNTAGMTAGEYGGTITITVPGFANSPYSLGVSLEILGTTTNPALVVLPNALKFSAISGGEAPPSESLMVSLQGGGSFSWTLTSTVTTPAGGTWLKTSNTSGTTAGTVQVSVNPSGLAAGTYTGQIKVTSGSSNVSVPVTFNVGAAQPAKLTLDPPVLNITYNPLILAPIALPAIQVHNAGSGTVNWTAKASGGAWLVVNPTSGTTPGQIGVPFNATGLTAGTYSGTITVTGGGSTATANVYLKVVGTPKPVVMVSPGSVAFSVANSIVTPAKNVIGVTSTFTGLSYTATASTGKGGAWLAVSPASGSVTTSSSITASINSSVAVTLSAGIYTGTITLKVPGAAQDTINVFVSLQVFAAGQAPLLQLSPGGLLFAAPPSGSSGATAVPTQTVNVLVVGATSLAWATSVTTSSGGAWLGISPTSGTTSTTATVSVKTTGLANGYYTGKIVFTPASASSKPVTLSVVLAVGPFALPFAAQSAATALFTEPADGFVSPASLPVNVSTTVVDGSGAPVTGATIMLKSSNGEPDTQLADMGSGVYTSVFQPMSSGPVVLTATGSGVSVAVSGDLEPTGDTQPVVFANGVVNAASFAPGATPLAAGSLASLFGANLTTASRVATSVPLPFALGDLSVTVGGYPAALVMAGSGQINLQVPFEVQGESQADVVVTSGGQVSVPSTILLAPAAPALFTLSQDGTGPAAVLHGDYSAVNPASPAVAGEHIMLFGTGFGAVQNAIATGSPSTGLNSITGQISVTIGGQPAIVEYAGLAPNLVGLYQINVIVPAGVAGDAAIQVTLGGVAATGAPTVSTRN